MRVFLYLRIMRTYELECWYLHAYENEDFETFVVEADTISDALKAIMPKRYFLIKAYLLNSPESYFCREFQIKRGQKSKRVDKNCKWQIAQPELLN